MHTFADRPPGTHAQRAPGAGLRRGSRGLQAGGKPALRNSCLYLTQNSRSAKPRIDTPNLPDLKVGGALGTDGWGVVVDEGLHKLVRA